jgi:Zn-dependent protease
LVEGLAMASPSPAGDRDQTVEQPPSFGAPPPGNRIRSDPPASGFRLGRIFGIPIYLHASWLIIFLLITVTLAKQFTSQHPGWSPQQHWALGIITSILFFGSVVFHELSHSVISKHYRITHLARPVERLAGIQHRDCGAAFEFIFGRLFLAGSALLPR